MGVTISSWITDSAGWQIMNRMQFATFSGGWRFSGGGDRHAVYDEGGGGVVEDRVDA